MKITPGGGVLVKLLPFGNDYADLGQGHAYVSRSALFKFQLPDILQELDRALYLDCDTILGGGFTDLFTVDISERYAAVCMDMHCMQQHQQDKVGHERYFNSGVMYLNLAKMRRDGIAAKLVEYKKNDPDSRFMDQDALNAVIGGNVTYVSPRFNLLQSYSLDRDAAAGSLRPMADFFSLSEEEMEECFSRPAILHLAGGLKPWNTMLCERFDGWVPYLAAEDQFACTLRYLRSMHDELERERKNDAAALEARLSETMRRLEALEARLSETMRRLEEVKGYAEFTKRHTLWGFCAGIWHWLKGDR